MKVLFQLFITFFKASSFTFGGGLAMLPLIKKDAVKKYNLIDEDEFYDYVVLAQTLPGVIALNTAVFVGKRKAGFIGALMAGLGAILPAFAAMLAAVMVIQSIPRDNIYVKGFFYGIKAASVALILDAALTLGKNVVKGAFAISVALVTFALIIIANFSAFPVLIAAGVAGVIYFSFKGDGEK